MDSTIVDPFKKWELYDRRDKMRDSNFNYAAGKSKKVAWYVDECDSHNNRMDFAKELQKYIQVSIFSLCLCSHTTIKIFL